MALDIEQWEIRHTYATCLEIHRNCLQNFHQVRELFKVRLVVEGSWRNSRLGSPLGRHSEKAIASISTWTSRGRRAASIVDRAGGFSLK